MVRIVFMMCHASCTVVTSTDECGDDDDDDDDE